MTPQRKPLLPPDGPRIRTGHLSLMRAITSMLIAHVDSDHSPAVLRKNWPGDKTAELLLKAATSPATTNTATWAGELAMTAVADFLLSLGPISAGAQLLRRGVQLQFGGAASIRVPGVVAAASNAGFVAEAAPIPVRQLALSGPTLEPRKFATICTFTRESFQHSLPTVESLTRLTLSEGFAAALDAALFDSTAGDATRPPGLLNGISPLTASNDPDALQAMRLDVAKLAGAVAAVAGDGSAIALVASPAQAVSLVLWGSGNLIYPVYGSSALAAGTCIAIATNALCSAVDPAPRFDISRASAMHMVDTSPAAIGTPGTPAVVAAPTRSLFQTDTIGLRLCLEVSWALRTSSGIAYMTGTGW